MTTTAHAKPEKLRCSDCGQTAACDCGAEYIPASVYARLALERNPGKSTRALAAATGVGKSTVDRLRGVPNGTPDDPDDPDGPDGPDGDGDAKVIGIDGKSYPARRKRTSSKKPPSNLPVKDQPEVLRFIKAMLKLSWEQKLYLWDHVLPKYHPRGVQD